MWQTPIIVLSFKLEVSKLVLFSSSIKLFKTFVLGAPHIHSLLWLNDENGEKALLFWSKSNKDDSDLPDDLKQLLENCFDSIISSDNDQANSNEDFDKKKEEISRLAASLIFGSIDDAKCRIHCREPSGMDSDVSCSDCDIIKERVILFNTHGCTFSCKKKMLKIKESEGKLDRTLKHGK